MNNVKDMKEQRLNGIYIYGEYAGVRINEKMNRKTGEIRKDFYFGLSVPKSGGYEGETVFIDVKLSTKQVNEGVPANFNHLVGERIGLPVWQSHNVWKDKVYSTNYLDSDRDVKVINPDKKVESPLKKVG